jgi:H+/Cl- antiporter ClcA
MRRGNIEATVRSRQIQRTWVYGLGLLTGTIAGLAAVAYRAVAAWLDGMRVSAFAWPVGLAVGRVAIWAILCAAAGATAAFMVKKAPLITGSGIPQVKALLMRWLHFDWLRELPLKFAGGALALGAGLSLGREGPSIQIGALIGVGISDVAKKSELKRYLVTAGAAAGISAAFNAPLAGVLFCLEELHRSFSPVMLTCSMMAAVAANAVSWLLMGGESVFNLHLASTMPIGMYPLILPAGIACGLAGAAFNASLLAAQKGMRRAMPKPALRLVATFVIGGLVAVAFPAIAGGGHALVGLAAEGRIALSALALLAAGKFAFTIISYASGAPGGIFLPMLAVGSLLGGLMGDAFAAFGLPSGFSANYVILGMVGFFTAVVRAPITGAILVSEMSGSFGHFPALILVSVIASLTAGLLRSEPIYDSLLAGFASDGTSDGECSDSAVVLHVPVLEGSCIDCCENAQALMPEGSVLIGVLRGENELLPRPGMDIHPGDIIEVLADEGEARRVKARLLELAAAKPGTVEAEC